MKKWEEKALAEFKKDAAKRVAKWRTALRDAANRRKQRLAREKARGDSSSQVPPTSERADVTR